MINQSFLWLVIEYSASLFEILVFQILFQSLFGCRQALSKYQYLISVPLAFLVLLLNNSTIPPIVTTGLFLLIFIAMAFLLYMGSLINKTIVLVVFYVAWGGTEMGTLFVLSQIYHTTTAFAVPSKERLVALVVSKLLLYGLMRIVVRLRLEKYQRLSARYFWGLMVFPVLSIISLFMLAQIWVDSMGPLHLVSNWLAASVSIAILFANLFIFALFDRISEESTKNTQLVVFEKQLDYERKYIKLLYEKSEDIRRLNHDMNNLLSPLYFYAKAGDLNRIKSALDNLERKVKLSSFMVRSGNLCVDAILSEKIAKAQEAEITVKHCLELQDSSLPIPEEDLCILLGNAMDNAIEACQRINDGPKVIDVFIRQNKGMFQIRVQNAYYQQPSVYNGVFQTTKANPSQHGFGIRSIEKIIEKNQGVMNIDTANSVFTLTMIFPI